MTCSTCHPLHARELKRGRGTLLGLILDLGVQRGGDGNSRAQIVFKGRRGVGMAIQGRRSFLKGAEGWGWQFKGADRF